MLRHCCFAHVVLIIWSFVASSSHALGPFIVTDLGDLPGGTDGSDAMGINEIGQVVGRASTELGFRAFLWQPTQPNALGGALYPLDESSGVVPLLAAAINDLGQVVGRTSNGRPFLWQPTAPNATVGTSIDLGQLPGGIPNCCDMANDINSRGQIVGVSRGAAGVHAFVWTPSTPNSASGSLVDLGNLPGGLLGHSFAYSINDKGQVSGGSDARITFNGQSNSYYRSFLWTPTVGNGSAGAMVDIGDLPGGSPVSWGGNDINELGQIVGRSGGNAGDAPFLWTPYVPNGSSGALVGLATLPGSSGEQTANAINDLGQVVGTSGDRAFYWDPILGTVNLNDYVAPGPSTQWLVREATDINNFGQIVGTALRDGVNHAVLLTPIPEPSMVLLILVSMIGALSVRCFQRL